MASKLTFIHGNENLFIMQEAKLNYELMQLMTFKILEHFRWSTNRSTNLIVVIGEVWSQLEERVPETAIEQNVSVNVS